jgi:hypothetical protein
MVRKLGVPLVSRTGDHDVSSTQTTASLAVVEAYVTLAFACSCCVLVFSCGLRRLARRSKMVVPLGNGPLISGVKLPYELTA